MPCFDVGKFSCSCAIHAHTQLTHAATSKNRIRQKILQDISFIARPGEVVAVLGGTGSGKTSLLDVIAFRNRGGAITGNIYMNETPCDVEIAHNKTGLVTNNEWLMPNLTVRETLTYLAKLRLVSLTRKQVQERVKEVMTQLDLVSVKNTYIGGDGGVGLTPGQRRRVMVATEMLINPWLLLCDEVTSGLDSATALHIIESLKAVAQKGHTIIMALDQPASELISLIDTVLVLSQGRVAFFGNVQQGLDHFHAVGFTCPDTTSPLDYFVDITSIDTRSAELEDSSRNQVDTMHVPLCTLAIYSEESKTVSLV